MLLVLFLGVSMGLSDSILTSSSFVSLAIYELANISCFHFHFEMKVFRVDGDVLSAEEFLRLYPEFSSVYYQNLRLHIGNETLFAISSFASSKEFSVR
jgi:hypothetical protein